MSLAFPNSAEEQEGKSLVLSNTAESNSNPKEALVQSALTWTPPIEGFRLAILEEIVWMMPARKELDPATHLDGLTDTDLAVPEEFEHIVILD